MCTVQLYYRKRNNSQDQADAGLRMCLVISIVRSLQSKSVSALITKTLRPEWF